MYLDLYSKKVLALCLERCDRGLTQSEKSGRIQAPKRQNARLTQAETFRGLLLFFSAIVGPRSETLSLLPHLTGRVLYFLDDA